MLGCIRAFYSSGSYICIASAVGLLGGEVCVVAERLIINYGPDAVVDGA